MTGRDYGNVTAFRRFTEHRLCWIAAPAPGVAKPKRREQVQGRWFRTAVLRVDSDQDVSRVRFRVLDFDVEETIFRERVGVPDLELGFHFGTRPVLREKFLVRKR